MQALFPNQPQLTNLWPKKHTETPNCVFLSKALFYRSNIKRPSISKVRVLDLNMEVKNLLKDKKFWIASFLITWAAALQGHMMWVQRQDSFKQKFGDINTNDAEK